MSSYTSISVDKLARLIGTPKCPLLIDVRTDAGFAGDPHLIPGAVRRTHTEVEHWAAEAAGLAAIVICDTGQKLSQGAAAWLRQAGAASADILDGGHQAWIKARQPVVPAAKLPPVDDTGRTLWVTRARPKIDRIACPWLIRRFIDRRAIFLFVPPPDITGVAEQFGATPFDVEGVFWSHRGELCTFDTMLAEWNLSTGPLQKLAQIVRGADTARLDLAPEAAGLLAASLGLSRMYADDLEQLEAGLLLYDAFYRWCRDASDETHNWPSNKIGA